MEANSSLANFDDLWDGEDPASTLEKFRALLPHMAPGPSLHAQIFKEDERVLGAKIHELAEERGVEASIAHDGMELVLR